jgi:hypothetical protein
MSGFWLINDEAVDDAAIQLLPTRVFFKKFKAALAGEQNEFSRFIKRGRSRPSGSIWARLRTQVFQRDDFTCQYCGVRGVKLECDHVIPVARGGTEILSNLATACFPCNRSKRDKLLGEWRQ